MSDDAAALARALVGSWQLVLREDRRADGSLFPDPALGPDPLGHLVYDAGGHFAAQFMRRDRSDSSPSASPTTAGRNNSRSVAGYDAYFGRYTVDPTSGLVTQTLEGALAPENVGLVVTRPMRVDGDVLTLRLETTAVDGTPVVRTLRWQRVG